MTMQELKDLLLKGDYSDETKSVISGILTDKTEITPGLVSQVKDVLQKELDFDFKELGVDVTSNPELQQIEKEYIEALDVVEKDLNSDMSFVEKELKDLEEMRKNIAKVSDEIKTGQIADKLKQSM